MKFVTGAYQQNDALVVASKFNLKRLEVQSECAGRQQFEVKWPQEVAMLHSKGQ